MSKQYTKVEWLSEEAFRRKASGETNREIGAYFGLSKAQIKCLVKLQNRCFPRKMAVFSFAFIPNKYLETFKNFLLFHIVLKHQKNAETTHHRGPPLFLCTYFFSSFTMVE